MRAEIEKVIDQVMASTPWHKYRVQVNRFKAEWILWRREFTLKQFMEEFFWKIDDPVINVYPHDFMPTRRFEDILNGKEEYSAQKVQERQDNIAKGLSTLSPISSHHSTLSRGSRRPSTLESKSGTSLEESSSGGPPFEKSLESKSGTSSEESSSGGPPFEKSLESKSGTSSEESSSGGPPFEKSQESKSGTSLEESSSGGSPFEKSIFEKPEFNKVEDEKRGLQKICQFDDHITEREYRVLKKCYVSWCNIDYMKAGGIVGLATVRKILNILKRCADME
jgi:hypothetical protein